MFGYRVVAGHPRRECGGQEKRAPGSVLPPKMLWRHVDLSSTHGRFGGLPSSSASRAGASAKRSSCRTGNYT
eukprot:594551-Pleurochrysis_carterae.AAC.1